MPPPGALGPGGLFYFFLPRLVLAGRFSAAASAATPLAIASRCESSRKSWPASPWPISFSTSASR